MWDQIVKYSHVMKDAVQVHMYLITNAISTYIRSISFPYGNFYIVNITLLQGCNNGSYIGELHIWAVWVVTLVTGALIDLCTYKDKYIYHTADLMYNLHFMISTLPI